MVSAHITAWLSDRCRAPMLRPPSLRFCLSGQAARNSPSLATGSLACCGELCLREACGSHAPERLGFGAARRRYPMEPIRCGL